MSMKATFLQCQKIFLQSMRLEFASKERIVTPLLFSTVVLLLFAFSFPEIGPEQRTRVFVAQWVISVFFALQFNLVQAFERESKDRIFDFLRTMPLSPNAYLGAKIQQVLMTAGLVGLITSFIAVLLQGQNLSLVFQPFISLTGFLMITGVAALGVLLAAITLKAQSKQLLFPLLFFPLSTPLLIATNELLCSHLENQAGGGDQTQGWLVVLVAFDVIYLTLTFLLGADILSE